MAAKYGYIGNNPADSSVFVARQAFSPSGITTTFTFASGYTIGYLDAYLNGSRLIEGQDYVATNGSTIDLVSSATGGDVLELLAYKAFNTVALTHAPGNFEVGTNLTVGGYISAGGSITGATFYGDGSNLTNTGSTLSAASGTQRVVLTSLTSGTMVTSTTDGDLTFDATTNTLSVTNVSIAGTLTYGDVTNVDSIGLITARTGIQVLAGGINVVGVVTATSAIVGTAVTINSSGINVVGVVTATSFVGSGANLTGISSVSFATTSFGLSGTPNIIVGITTASQLGINTTTIPTKLYVSGNAASNIVGLGTTTANTTLDFSMGNNFSLTLNGSIVLQNPTGVTTGQSGMILIQQDGTGSRTVGFGSSWDFPSATAPTVTATASALSSLVYFVRSSTSIVTNSILGIGTL